MKVKNDIIFNEKFFSDVYNLASTVMDNEFPDANLNITINNFPATDEFVSQKTPPSSLMNWQAKVGKNQLGKVKYNIDFVEISRMDFANEDIPNLMLLSYKSYFDSLGVIFCGETVSIATLLHELGHVSVMENLAKYYHNDYVMIYNSYDAATTNVFNSVFRPWKTSFIASNMARKYFDCMESSAEMFVFEKFPQFLGLLKTHGFMKDQ